MLSDLYGFDFREDELPPFREEAQSIPGVLAIQNLLTASIGPLTLRTIDSSGVPLPNQAPWTTRVDGQSPLIRMQQTVCDIFYDGLSLWSINAKNAQGYPLSMSNVWHKRWRFDRQAGVIYIDEKAASPADYVLITSAYPGILTAGARTLRTALYIERALNARSKASIPIVKLKNIDASGTSDLATEEVQGVIDRYVEARQSPHGALMYLPSNYDIETLSDNPNNWLLEARAGVIADLAKLSGVPSGLLEGAQFGSLNYSTELGQLSRFTDFNILTYTAPITSALSQGNVTPSTTTVQFDFSPLKAQAPEPLTDKGAPVAPNNAASEAKTSND